MDFNLSNHIISYVVKCFCILWRTLVMVSRSGLSDHSPMLFVDLLTRPGHQGEALREPRVRQHLRISIILLLRQHVFHS